MKNVTESLVGRVGILDLYGLSNRDINVVNEDVFTLDMDILSGKQKVKKLFTIELI